MAMIEAIDLRLWRWGEAVKNGGDGSGYPIKSTLHEDWSPPSPGMTPSMKVVPASDARQTHGLVRCLSPKQQASLIAHYVKRMTHQQAAEAMQCQPDTVKDRIEAAHREIARMLDSNGLELCNIHSIP
jgi:DNA-directed RNA polymerase specialized sigma24 family protein